MKKKQSSNNSGGKLQHKKFVNNGIHLKFYSIPPKFINAILIILLAILNKTGMPTM